MNVKENDALKTDLGDLAGKMAAAQAAGLPATPAGLTDEKTVESIDQTIDKIDARLKQLEEMKTRLEKYYEASSEEKLKDVSDDVRAKRSALHSDPANKGDRDQALLDMEKELKNLQGEIKKYQDESDKLAQKIKADPVAAADLMLKAKKDALDQRIGDADKKVNAGAKAILDLKKQDDAVVKNLAQTAPKKTM